MPRDTTVMLGFGGPAVELGRKVELGKGYQVWNLRALSFDEFVTRLRRTVRPINESALYERPADSPETRGITRALFKKCSWAVRFPKRSGDLSVGKHWEVEFLCNLYSPEFLYPVFHAGDYGIEQNSDRRGLDPAYSILQQQATLFARPEFAKFCDTMRTGACYALWVRDRAARWRSEDWRLFVASQLYLGLREFHNRKSYFGWQRESADIAAMLEALLTAGDKTTAEVGYRLRKRAAVLLADRLPSIEKDIKKLYETRSTFVHGSFFASIPKEMKRQATGLPLPNFSLLRRQKEYARFVLVGYLCLARGVGGGKFGGSKNAMDGLESGIIDTGCRASVRREIGGVLDLLSSPVLVPHRKEL